MDWFNKNWVYQIVANMRPNLRRFRNSIIVNAMKEKNGNVLLRSSCTCILKNSSVPIKCFQHLKQKKKCLKGKALLKRTVHDVLSHKLPLNNFLQKVRNCSYINIISSLTISQAKIEIRSPLLTYKTLWYILVYLRTEILNPK